MSDRKEALRRRLEASAVRAEVRPVVMGNGDEFLLRQLTNDEMIRVAQASGDGEDRDAQIFIKSFRFALVDDDGTPLLDSFDEAAAFINSLSLDDFAALQAAVDDTVSLADTEVVEAGKAS
jgi:hypothetical protein